MLLNLVQFSEILCTTLYFPRLGLYYEQNLFIIFHKRTFIFTTFEGYYLEVMIQNLISTRSASSAATTSNREFLLFMDLVLGSSQWSIVM